MHRPSNPHSEAIHAYLTALGATGFRGVPLPVDLQTDGVERLRYIDGDVPLPPYPEWAQSDAVLASVTVLMGDFHRASAAAMPPLSTWSDELADPSGGSLVCHNDVCLENVVFRDGSAVSLLDFDFAAPGRPVYDLAQFARMCVPIDDDRSAGRLGWRQPNRPVRLRLVADTYGLGPRGRRELLGHLDHSMLHGGAFVQRRAAAGDLNFVRMLAEMGGMERYERRLRWWLGNRPDFVAALDPLG